MRLWSRHKSSTPDYEDHSVLEWLLMGVHVSQQSWWYLLLSVRNRLRVLLRTSLQPAWIVFSSLLYRNLSHFWNRMINAFKCFWKPPWGCWELKLFSQSLWNFWRSLKSSINYCFLKHCRKLWGKHHKGSVSMSMGQSWLKQFIMWEYTCPCSRTGALSTGEEFNSLVILIPVAALY